MAEALPPLRRNLDLVPSPLKDRPGLLIRDPYRYTDTVVVIPPPLVPLLAHFDGVRTELDLRETLVRLTGDLQVGETMRLFVDALAQGGFLENDVLARLKEARHNAFAQAPRREPAHAGSAYPGEPGPLRETIARYLDGAAEGPAASRDGLLGVAAPHVSPEGGWRCYRAAYRALDPTHQDRTFVVLGTSHYGDAQTFGLTRKPFATPFGEAVVDDSLAGELAAKGGPAVRAEDYCHSVEHSIEFQVVFLQHLYGPRVRIVPILCGPLARAMQEGRPEEDTGVARFFGALAEIAAREGDRLFWILGIDLAHLGRRYGDALAARADHGAMIGAAERDRLRLGRVLEGDAGGFWSLIQENQDDLRWCGASPLYAFMKAVGPVRGELLRYEQWNIDPQSVVSFAGIAFARGDH